MGLPVVPLEACRRTISLGRHRGQTQRIVVAEIPLEVKGSLGRSASERIVCRRDALLHKGLAIEGHLLVDGGYLGLQALPLQGLKVRPGHGFMFCVPDHLAFS